MHKEYVHINKKMVDVIRCGVRNAHELCLNCLSLGRYSIHNNPFSVGHSSPANVDAVDAKQIFLIFVMQSTIDRSICHSTVAITFAILGLHPSRSIVVDHFVWRYQHFAPISLACFHGMALTGSK